jgi:hypothetical protein
MKRCPRCNESYSDEHLNFCLNDGELLMQTADEPAGRPFDDPPPTVLMNDARVTNPANWQQTASPAPWQAQQNIQAPRFDPPSFLPSRDKTLPTIAMVLGILSMVMICCYGGIWLGLPAAIVGFMGMKNADGDPSRYDGRGMAIAGMVLGTVSFLSAFVILFFALIAR